MKQARFLNSAEKELFEAAYYHVHMMTVHMMTKRLMTCLLTVLLLIAGPYFIQEEGDVLLASSKSGAQDMIPPMDEKVPAKTETATFALG